MNPTLLSLTDGTPFFVGLVLASVSVLLLARFSRTRARPVLTVSVVLGILLVVISATPLPLWLYAVWTVLAVLGLVVVGGNPRKPLLRRGCVTLLLLASNTLVLLEVPHHRAPRVRVPDGTTFYVLGDSISAGTGMKGETLWPDLLDGMTSLRVVNLAQPGATVESGFRQANGISSPGSLVLVELGGNDLLGPTSSSEFRLRLDKLVASLRAHRHEVILLELPLFPFQNAFGRAQRDVAATHGATLLPKRYFSRVLGAPNATSDGLHLSNEGHRIMAELLYETLDLPPD